ncbi:methyl-accepting chemotaxis protein [Paenibacillus wulumuqiensis]|uniref:methyl-accepting chemotaxis protein n=1 Tax=Paenibacillus wulumuqiensis TaxID=1567107 RepID=UPI000619C8B1|nr:methyl-accepting chemotaxis protein [Paenibacillus wulumuqiensis]
MYEKNKVMNMLCLVTVALSFIVFALHKYTHLIPDLMTAAHTQSAATSSSVDVVRYILLAVPLLLLISSLLLFSRNSQHSYLPIMNTLILTLGSIALIAAGDGLVEYHFSVFMVVAFVVFYDSLALVLLTTVIFAVHHLAGFFLFPVLICGQHEYSFSLLLIHAVFLLLTSGAAILLIIAKQRSTQALEAEKQQSEALNETAVIQLQQSGQYMEESSSSLQRNSQSLVALSEEIATSVQTISQRATTELLPSQKGSEQKLDQITAVIHEITGSLEQLHDASLMSIGKAKNGRESLTQITARIEALQQDVNEMAAGIHNINDHANEISRFIEIIAHLAEETNLLALNASIEAARAGEHGQSFGVVAQQVKKLSIETADALKMMSSIIHQFTRSTGAALQTSERGTSKMQETLADTHQTSVTFDQILESAEITGQHVSNITSRTTELNQHTRTVNEATHYVTRMIEEAVISQQSVGATIEEQLQHSHSVNDAAQQLHQMGDQLNELVRNFSNKGSSKK